MVRAPDGFQASSRNAGYYYNADIRPFQRDTTVTQLRIQYQLRPFHPLYAGLVASWVRDDDELFWLAPHTPPPITQEKVRAWTAERGRPRLFWSSSWPEATGYAEINDLREHSGDVWVGHFILAPSRRGKGLSVKMLRLLLDEAFGPLKAQRVALMVFPENEPAVRCYRGCGFRVTAHQDKTFVTRAGSYRMVEMAIERAEYEAALRKYGPPL